MMSDAARSSFNAQLASVMESLLAAAVCEISRIFEGSLSDSRAEVERSREEVVLLKTKLAALEGRLEEDSSVRDTETGMTFDPSSCAQPTGAGFGKATHLSEFSEAEPQQGRDTASQVKGEVEVTELESDSFTQGGAGLARVHVKEESTGEDPEPRSVEGAGTGAPRDSAHLCTSSDASLEAVADGTVRWTVIPGTGLGPVLTQKPEEGLPAADLGCVPCQPLPSRPSCVTKGRGDIVLGGDMAVGSAYGARTRLRPSPVYAHRNGHAHRTAPDRTLRSTPSCAHRPVTGQRTSQDHPHRAYPDRVLSSSPPTSEGTLAEGLDGCTSVPCSGEWAGPAQPGQPPAGQRVETVDVEVGFERCPYAVTHKGPAAQNYHMTTSLPALSAGGALRGGRLNATAAAKVKLSPALSAVARERPYSCPYCGKAFFYPSQQRRHLLRHTGERLYRCTLCQKSFVTPSELSVHVRVHTGEKPYSCLQCGKRFNRTGNLRAHERDVHLGKRPFSCAECGKTFAQKGNLRTHQQRVHQRHLPNTE